MVDKNMVKVRGMNLLEFEDTFKSLIIQISGHLNSYHEKELLMWWEEMKKNGKEY